MEQQTSATEPQTRPARPLGVTILAIVSGIFGVLGLLSGLALFGLSGMIGTVGGSSVAGLGLPNALMALATAVLALAFAYGAWTLKSWAWPLGLAFAAFAVVSGLLGLAGGTTEITSVIVGLAIAGFVVWYLMQPTVKAAFGRA